MSELIKDTSWLRLSFLSSHRQITDRDRYSRSGGWLKFTDTTLGGNTAINVPYQFTRYADIKERRLLPHIGKGMGEWYSKVIDDWGHNVHFRVGVPAYNSLIGYLLTAVDGPTARYVQTGRVPGVFAAIGELASWVISAAYWELTLISLVVSTILNLTTSRFYYLKPTMFSYWKTVQTILNSLSANLGLTLAAERGDDPNTKVQLAGGNNLGLIESARESLPQTFRSPVVNVFSGKDVGVDIHAVASRAQGLEVQHKEELHRLMEKLEGRNYTAQELARIAEQAMRDGPINKGNVGHIQPRMHNGTLHKYITNFTRLQAYSNQVSEDQSGVQMDEIQSVTSLTAGSTAEEKTQSVASWFKQTVDTFTSLSQRDGPNWKEQLIAELRDGSQWFSLRVADSTQSVTESFSNQSEKSDIANTFNKISEAARNIWFNTGGMSTGIAPIDGAIGAVGDMITGALTGSSATALFANPIMGLMYGAQLDSPKRWRSSSTQMGNTSFKLELRCGYGNIVSYYQDILVPLAMCLALVLPRGTGPQSFGSPYYVQYYSKGRAQVKCGLVSSMSITRGTGNTPWSKRGFPMGVDIDFTIEDMTDTMFSPNAQGIDLKGLWFNSSEENAMGDYMAVLTALGMNEQEYFIPRMKRRLGTMVNAFDSWLSPHRWAALGGELLQNNIGLFADQTSVRR